MNARSDGSVQARLIICYKKVSMIRKYHNHKLQTNPCHFEEEPPQQSRVTPGKQRKYSNQLSLPHQDDWKTRMDIKLRTTKHRTITESHNGSNNQHRINNNITTVSEQTAAKATGRLKCFLLVLNLRLKALSYYEV